MKYLSARERFPPFSHGNTHTHTHTRCVVVYKTKGHNFLQQEKFYSPRFFFGTPLVGRALRMFCSNMSSLSSDSHDTKCSNDRKTTTFGLLLTSSSSLLWDSHTCDSSYICLCSYPVNYLSFLPQTYWFEKGNEEFPFSFYFVKKKNLDNPEHFRCIQ
jgi:hypothetical protein